MKNMFETCEQVSESAAKSWESEGKNTQNEFFKSFELGWFRSAYRDIYFGMNRILAAYEEKINECNELIEKLEQYEK